MVAHPENRPTMASETRPTATPRPQSRWDRARWDNVWDNDWDKARWNRAWRDNDRDKARWGRVWDKARWDNDRDKR